MSNPVKPGPPFDEQQAPYSPDFHGNPPVGVLNGTPQAPNFEKDKQHYSAGYPVHCVRTSGLLSRSEPILTPQLLVSRYLKGIPLTFPNGDSYSSDDLKDQIKLAMNEIELQCRITLTQEQFSDSVPFDAALYRSFIYMKTEQGPILRVEKVRIVSSDGYSVFEIPGSWLTSSQFSKNIVNVVPILGAYSVSAGSGIGAYGGIPYIAVFSQLGFVPSFWQIDYVTGVSKVEGQFPTVINDLVGVIAAMNMLSNIQNMFLNSSQSLSRDGISQSSSGPSTRAYTPYIETLEKRKVELMSKIKATFSQKFLVSNI